MAPRRRRCPHAEIQFCPLYVAAHGASGLGCDFPDPDHCDWAGRSSYQVAIKRLAEHPAGRDAILACDLSRQERDRREQRKRNLRLNGLN